MADLCRHSERQVCDECHGTGEVFTHSNDCDDDLCALNGDMHSCVGQVARCSCIYKHDKACHKGKD